MSSEYVKAKARERFRVDEVKAPEFDACIDANLDKPDPAKYCADKFGIPIIHTGFEKESSRHADFQRILNEFNNYYCKGKTPCSKGETEYYVWLTAVGLDEAREYGSATESFSFAKDMISLWREDKLNKYYRVLVGFPTTSMNGNVYRERDLDASAESLVGVNPNLNHKDHWIFNREHGFEDNVTFEKAKYEDGAVEAILKVPKTVTCPICDGRPLYNLIDEKRIVNVSLEGACQNNPMLDGECQGFNFTGCALLTTDVLPGIPMARIFPLEAYMKEAFSRSPFKGEKLKVEIIMNKKKKEAIVSPETPNVPADSEAEMPGGDFQCEKGFRWSGEQGKCIKISCPEGETWNDDVGACVKIVKPSPEGTDVSTGTPAAGDTSTVPIEQVDTSQDGQGLDEHGCVVGTEKWDGEKCVPIENLPKDQGMPSEQTFTLEQDDEPVGPECEAGYHPDPETGECVKNEPAKPVEQEGDAPPPCPSGQMRNPQTGECEDVKVPPEPGFIKPLSEEDKEPCADGFHRDEEGNCVPDDTAQERMKRWDAEERTANTSKRLEKRNHEYILLDKSYRKVLGICTAQKRTIRKLEQQGDTFYKERVDDLAQVKHHRRRADDLAEKLKENQRQLQDTKSELDVVTEKYNHQLKTNLELTKELRKTKESWLTISKDKDQTEEKLKKAKRLGKVIVKV